MAETQLSVAEREKLGENAESGVEELQAKSNVVKGLNPDGSEPDPEPEPKPEPKPEDPPQEDKKPA
jgi:hypothetical protein